MERSHGRAYVFVRWTAPALSWVRFGDLAWAFEFNDRSGRFHCFYCGACEPSGSATLDHGRPFWYEKYVTVPELTAAMSNRSRERPGYDEVKVFPVDNPDSDLALKYVTQRSSIHEDAARRIEPMEEIREILLRYGVRALPHAKGFSAPFLWYNMLPARSVPIRKLPVHLFQLRASPEKQSHLTQAQVEDAVRSIAQARRDVFRVGECFVAGVGGNLIVGLNIEVHPSLSVGQGRSIAQQLERDIRTESDKIRHVFVQVEPFDSAG